MLRLHRMSSSTLCHAASDTAKRLVLFRCFSEVAPNQPDPSPSSSRLQSNRQQQLPPVQSTVVDEERAEFAEAALALQRKILEADKCFRTHVKSFMTPDFRNIVHTLLTPDVQYDDLVRGYKTRGVDQLIWLTAKTRFYLNLKSPMNRFEWLGSAIHPETDSLTVLWRLSTLASMGFFYKYSPMRFFNREAYPPRIIDGAVDCYFTPMGLIHQMVNRAVTAKDREDAQLNAQTMQHVAEKIQKQRDEEEKSKYSKYL